MSEGHEIERVLVTARSSDGRQYAAVVCRDGALALTCDGALLNGCRWSSGDFDGCISELLKLSGMRGQFSDDQ